MKKISHQIESLETKQQQLQNRLQGLRSRQARIARAEETRRLVLAGKWLFKLCGGDAVKVGSKLAEAGLLPEADRRLFANQS
ncbi:MAG: hypothetical protein V4625_12805 [Pseudomonadota bacterium]